MITGVRPTGSITLANYIGGIKGFVEQQYKYNSLIFIADIHGLTTYINPKEIRNNILDITAMYMACGIDIKNTALFMQSDVLEHCNLGFLMSFQCSVGELSRMTQFKSKKQSLGKNEKYQLKTIWGRIFSIYRRTQGKMQRNQFKKIGSRISSLELANKK